MYTKYVIPAAAMAAVAAADSKCKGSTTLSSAADATGLAACSTYSGDIALATSLGGAVSIGGVKEITGSLIADGCSQLNSLEADNLETIGKQFKINGATILSGLTFPKLTDVKEIQWTHLGGPQELSFSENGVQMASSVNIEDTQLENLNGINLQTVDTMILANNVHLSEVNMQLGNISDRFSVQANGQKFSVALPNLIWGNDFDISNVTDISMPSLKSTNGSLNLIANFFEGFSAPNLTTVGGTLTFAANPNQKNASFPELTTISGGFVVANNTKFEKVTGFPALKKVGGAVDFFGNFTDVELPKLKDVEGSFNLQSYNDITDSCKVFDGLAGGAIRGGEVCKPLVDHPGGEGTDPTSTHGSDSSSPSKGASAHMIIPGTATGVLGIMAAIFGML